MSEMFFGCGGAEIRDDLPYNINDSEEFCFYKGTEIIFTDFNIQNVQDMSRMFYEATINKSILNFINTFNTESVTNMSYMFECAVFLEDKISLFNFNTKNVVDMSYMFSTAGMNQPKDINISNFNTEIVTNMEGMFCGCEYLTN